MLFIENIILLISTSGLYSLSRTLQPLLLGYLVTSLMSSEPQKNYVLYGCALTRGINTLVMCLSMHHLDYQSELLVIRFSSALINTAAKRLRMRSLRPFPVSSLCCLCCSFSFGVLSVITRSKIICMEQEHRLF